MNEVLKFIFGISLMACFSVQAFADDVREKQIKDAVAAIGEGVDVFATRFVDNVPTLSDAQITDCYLSSEVTYRSAAKEYGENPSVTDLKMLTIAGQVEGWKRLHAHNSKLGNNVNVGRIYEAFSDKSMTKEELAKLFVSTFKECTVVFEATQLAGLSDRAGG